jgi:hypothetical protein
VFVLCVCFVCLFCVFVLCFERLTVGELAAALQASVEEEAARAEKWHQFVTEGLVVDGVHVYPQEVRADGSCLFASVAVLTGVWDATTWRQAVVDWIETQMKQVWLQNLYVALVGTSAPHLESWQNAISCENAWWDPSPQLQIEMRVEIRSYLTRMRNPATHGGVMELVVIGLMCESRPRVITTAGLNTDCMTLPAVMKFVPRNMIPRENAKRMLLAHTST